MKIYVDDIPGLMESAQRLTASLGWNPEQKGEAEPDFYKGIDPALPKWKRDQLYIERMQEWVRAQRLKALRQFDLKVLIWLAELDEDEQGRVIWQMFQEGIILDPAKVDDMIADWNAHSGMGYDYPKQPEKMSDDVLDRHAQYVKFSSGLLDDFDSIWEKEWPEIE